MSNFIFVQISLISGDDESNMPLTFIANSLRQDTSETDTNNMSGREDELATSLLDRFVSTINDVDNLIQRHSRDHGVILNRRAV